MEKFQKDSFQKADEIFNNLREQIDNIETVSQAIYEKVSKIEKQLTQRNTDNESIPHS